MAESSEVELWRRYREDDSDDARDELIVYYQTFVRQLASVVVSRFPRSIEVDDLASAGTLGLMRAIERFDPDLGVPFRSYAAHRIKGMMLDEVRRSDSLPKAKREDAKAIDQARVLLAAEGESPTLAKVASVTGFGESKIIKNDVYVHSMSDLQLIDEVAMNDGEESLATAFDDPGSTEAVLDLRDKLVRKILHLEETYRYVLALHYVFDLTNEQIGIVMGLAQNRVQQMRVEAVRLCG